MQEFIATCADILPPFGLSLAVYLYVQTASTSNAVTAGRFDYHFSLRLFVVAFYLLFLIGMVVTSFRNCLCETGRLPNVIRLIGYLLPIGAVIFASRFNASRAFTSSCGLALSDTDKTTKEVRLIAGLIGVEVTSVGLSRHLDMPVVYGTSIWRPRCTVILSDLMEFALAHISPGPDYPRCARLLREYILLHELSHVRNRDASLLLVSRAIFAGHCVALVPLLLASFSGSTSSNFLSVFLLSVLALLLSVTSALPVAKHDLQADAVALLLSGSVKRTRIFRILEVQDLMRTLIVAHTEHASRCGRRSGAASVDSRSPKEIFGGQMAVLADAPFKKLTSFFVAMMNAQSSLSPAPLLQRMTIAMSAEEPPVGRSLSHQELLIAGLVSGICGMSFATVCVTMAPILGAWESAFVLTRWQFAALWGSIVSPIMAGGLITLDYLRRDLLRAPMKVLKQIALGCVMFRPCWIVSAYCLAVWTVPLLFMNFPGFILILLWLFVPVSTWALVMQMLGPRLRHFEWRSSAGLLCAHYLPTVLFILLLMSGMSIGATFLHAAGSPLPNAVFTGLMMIAVSFCYRSWRAVNLRYRYLAVAFLRGYWRMNFAALPFRKRLQKCLTVDIELCAAGIGLGILLSIVMAVVRKLYWGRFCAWFAATFGDRILSFLSTPTVDLLELFVALVVSMFLLFIFYPNWGLQSNTPSLTSVRNHLYWCEATWNIAISLGEDISRPHSLWWVKRKHWQDCLSEIFMRLIRKNGEVQVTPYPCGTVPETIDFIRALCVTTPRQQINFDKLIDWLVECKDRRGGFGMWVKCKRDLLSTSCMIGIASELPELGTCVTENDLKFWRNGVYTVLMSNWPVWDRLIEVADAVFFARFSRETVSGVMPRKDIVVLLDELFLDTLPYTTFSDYARVYGLLCDLDLQNTGPALKILEKVRETSPRRDLLAERAPNILYEWMRLVSRASGALTLDYSPVNATAVEFINSLTRDETTIMMPK